MTLGKGGLSLLLAVLLAGCASVQYAFEATPQRTRDAFSDPIRRTHLITEVGLTSSAVGVGIACAAFLSPTLVGVLVCPFVGVAYYYGMYEFVLEPWSKERVAEGKPSLVGPYWERGPQDEEHFIYE